MGGFPSEIILEVTNRCNEACVMCHFHGLGVERKRELGDMPREIWEKVLREIEAVAAPVYLITHGAGEPLLYPHLFDLLEQALAIPHVTVGFMTNGMALDEQTAERLVRMGVHWLAFSVDGVDPELHRRFRRGSDLPRIEENIRRLVRIKERFRSVVPRLSFNMVCLEEIADQEERYVRKWLPVAEKVMVSVYRPIGWRRIPGVERPRPRKACSNLWRQMVVTWDGRVPLCCEDIHCDAVVGDLKEASVAEIWNGEAMAKIRAAHEEGRFEEVPFCLPCDTWAAHEAGRKEELPFAIRETTVFQRIYRPLETAA